MNTMKTECRRTSNMVFFVNFTCDQRLDQIKMTHKALIIVLYDK